MQMLIIQMIMKLKQLLIFINSPEMAAIGQIDNLNRLHHELCTKDWFMTLLDLKSYIQTKDKAFADYENRLKWAKMSLTNMPKAGIFL